MQPASPLDYHKLEMLHGIGDVHPSPIDPCCLQRRIQQLTRRTDEGVALPVLLIPGLLPNEHHIRCARPLTKHCLGGVDPEITASAAGGGGSQLGQRGFGRNEVGS